MEAGRARHPLELRTERQPFNRRESLIQIAKPKFNLGQVVATPGAIHALRQSGEMPAKFLNRHVSGDWGDISDNDRELNEEAVEDGSRIMSVYSTSRGTKIWIITDASNEDGRREVTTLLLPEDY